MKQLMWVIIPAAGVGQRMQSNSPKQYIRLVGQTILDRTLALFIDHPMIVGIALGLDKNDAYWTDSQWVTHPKIHIYHGGEERADTVLKGLLYLQETQNIKDQQVLVHDAARPLLSRVTLDRILSHESSQGAILALPARDTVKQQKIGKEGVVVNSTLDRNHIWLAQTPQKFPADALLKALTRAQADTIEMTDECSAMEYMGWHPELVEGETRNFKITFPEDLLLAKALLSYVTNLKN